jgi:hypothetical protein
LRLGGRRIKKSHARSQLKPFSKQPRNSSTAPAPLIPVVLA